MIYPTLFFVHVFGAVLSLLAGTLAMVFRKGGGLHAAAGTVFSVSMLTMSAAGATIAASFKPNFGNVMGGALTFYLVATAWMTARRRERKTGIFDIGALLLIFAIAATQMTIGVMAKMSPRGLMFGYPAPMYFIFGTIALLFTASDIRMILHGGVAGVQRIARHLFRMCLALLFAALSFYPSRAHLFSKAINDSNVLYLPHLLLVGAMLYWMFRVRARKRLPRSVALETSTTLMGGAAYER
jgi:hypothetical protein